MSAISFGTQASLSFATQIGIWPPHRYTTPIFKRNSCASRDPSHDSLKYMNAILREPGGNKFSLAKLESALSIEWRNK
jgi:hypothetical protein